MLAALDEEGFSFFLDHLGVKRGKLCLAKRLDYRWQKNLKKKGILVLDEYIHWIADVPAMIEEYQQRKKRGYRMAYDSEHVPNADFVWWEVSETAEYEGIPSLKEIQGIREG